jgi:hypothetical protein
MKFLIEQNVPVICIELTRDLLNCLGILALSARGLIVRRLSSSLHRFPILIKLGESPVVFEHFVLWKLEPFSRDRPKYPKYEKSESDCGYDSNNSVDH